MPRPLKYGYEMKKTTVYLRSDLLEKAKMKGINLSEAINNYLHELIYSTKSEDELLYEKEQISSEIKRLSLELKKIDKLIAVRRGDFSVLNEQEKQLLTTALERIKNVHLNHLAKEDHDSAVETVATYWSNELSSKGLLLDTQSLINLALKHEKKD